LVDETSLLGLQLLAELDHALHFAKERPDLWFGGVSLIFSGDFFQYPPVAGSALYTPISRYAGQTDDEIQKRLGRLAWKTINTVVSLDEQQRMKADVAYGAAVTRLRARQCTYKDVEMFNARVIKAADNPDGVDMGTVDNVDAAAIVATNAVREILNVEKARGSHGDRELVEGNALDKCSHRALTLDERQQLLRLNVAAIKSSRALPGRLTFYVGMPVILRMRNISTDLGITNGSQGTIRQIFTALCPDSLMYLKCVIVEFPDSKVRLSGLPPKWFPVLPISWTFTTLLKNAEGVEEKCRVTRQQMPIQPAFAVTGHSAQGKTLPKVLVNLEEGGFGAYVAASRAQSRTGICLLQPVTIEQLNKPLPRNLLLEVRRFDAIEHNTYVRRGLRTGEPVPVPDAEADLAIQTHMLTAHFETEGQIQRTKRKRDDEHAERVDSASRSSQKQCTDQEPNTSTEKRPRLQQENSTTDSSAGPLPYMSMNVDLSHPEDRGTTEP
jgi:hypothetical protein